MNPFLELMPFQKEGVRFLTRNKRAMLAWDPGTGKTPTTVRACAEVEALRVLVFCPPIATSVWRSHFADWAPYDDIRVLNAGSALSPYKFIEGKGVRIIPYSRARAHPQRNGLMEAATRFSDQWDVVVLDECHYLKNSGAQRTKAVYGDKIDLENSPLGEATYVWALSGTPLLNHTGEVWTHLHALAPSLILNPTAKAGRTMDELSFMERYCVTRPTPYGIRVVGAKNVHELSQKLRGFMDRKRIKDVLTDLPDLRIVEHPLPFDTSISVELRQMMEAAVQEVGSDEELLEAVQNNLAWSSMRRLTGMTKVPGVAELVADTLNDSDEKVIVFAHHREVVQGLTKLLVKHKPLEIHGGTPHDMREAYIRMFQTIDSYRLIIISIEAAGEAITLNELHNVIIAEPSPVPAKNLQAIARAHRKGQKHPVLARFVLLPGTLDARLMSIIARKTRDIARIVDPDTLHSLRPIQAELFPEDQPI